jgi:hypothetical protein
MKTKKQKLVDQRMRQRPGLFCGRNIEVERFLDEMGYSG